MKNKTQKKYNKQEKKQKIETSALKLIETVAIDKISTNKIAKLAGVSIGTIYMYYPKGFPSILKSIAENSIDKVFEFDVEGLLLSNGLSSILKLYLTRYVKRHQDTEPFLRACEIAKMNNPEMFLGIENQLEINLSEIIELFDAIPAFKKINPIDFEKDIIRFIGIIDAVVHKHILYIPLFPNDEELVEFLYSVVKKLLIDKYPVLNPYLE